MKKFICLIITLCMTLSSFAVLINAVALGTATPEITVQPSEENGYLFETDCEFASYQWYMQGEKHYRPCDDGSCGLYDDASNSYRLSAGDYILFYHENEAAVFVKFISGEENIEADEGMLTGGNNGLFSVRFNDGYLGIYAFGSCEFQIYTESRIPLNEGGRLNVTEELDGAECFCIADCNGIEVRSNTVIAVYKSPVTKGDFNFDGDISMSDVLAARKYIAGVIDFPDEVIAVTDTNGDSDITMSDVLILRKFIGGVIEEI